MANKTTSINGHSYGDIVSTITWTAWAGLYCNIYLPTGVLAHSGNRPVWVTSVALYIASHSGGNDKLRFQIGGNTSDYITVSPGNGGDLSGYANITARYLNGGHMNLRVLEYSSLYFGYANDGRTSCITNNGVAKRGASLMGGITYVTAPTAPLGFHITEVNATDMTVAWSSPADLGGYGNSDTRYRVVRGTDSGITQNVVVTQAGTARSVKLTNLIPGQSYTMVVQAMNNLTDWASDYSQNSNYVVATTQAGGGKIRVGGGWANGVGRIRDNGVWVPLTGKIRENGAWVDLGE